ncbi:MAG: alpha/beta fold hydrolase, partial [Ilumatobacter sp.]|nr:alpha/beta fold hydrolase [Ilumatobacter sp.]
WASVIGGSMGGMQVLEWASTYPDRVGSIVPIASCMEASAQQIAWGVIGRRAIRLDPNFHGGDYYDRPAGPAEGLAVARQVAQVTFRSDNAFTQRFGRELTDQSQYGDSFGLWQEFEVERYLQYHGDKLVRRFDANSYLIIGKAMDLHDIGRGRGSVERAMARINVPSLTIGINSDILYPPYQQVALSNTLRRPGLLNEYVEVDSPHGHDAFLIHVDEIGEPIRDFLARLG